MSILVLKNGVTIANEAIADSISFDENMIHCRLKDQRVISVPLSWYPTLAGASREQRETWEFIAGGEGIHWPLLDEDLSVRGFLAGCKEEAEPTYSTLPTVSTLLIANVSTLHTVPSTPYQDTKLEYSDFIPR